MYLFELDHIWIVVRTFGPRLSFAGCALVNTNDVHASGPTAVVGYIYNIFFAGTLVRVLQHARVIYVL